jgi:hypothetical protein
MQLWDLTFFLSTSTIRFYPMTTFTLKFHLFPMLMVLLWHLHQMANHRLIGQLLGAKANCLTVNSLQHPMKLFSFIQMNNQPATIGIMTMPMELLD